ncbi:MAG: hypothetical protein HOG34_04310 [Bacteroidetes bacterium]|nr:hypothetical protein [Bacteroidota bacterium]
MSLFKYLPLVLVLLFTQCDPFDDLAGSEDPSIPEDYGYAEVEFILPDYKGIPKDGVHRVALSFSYTIDSLFRSEYFEKVNVSDHKALYRLVFPAGEYYWEAVITCSCGGDTCLNGGFPGGKFGMKYDFDEFLVVTGETTTIKTRFTY